MSEFSSNFVICLAWPAVVVQMLSEIVYKAFHPKLEDGVMPTWQKIALLAAIVVLMVVGSVLPYTTDLNPIIALFIAWLLTAVITAVLISLSFKKEPSKAATLIIVYTAFVVIPTVAITALCVSLVLSVQWAVGLFV